jgi:hypothetical protein
VITHVSTRIEDCVKLHGHVVGDGCVPQYGVFLMSLVLMAGTFLIIIVLKNMRGSRFFRTKVSRTVDSLLTRLSIRCVN